MEENEALNDLIKNIQESIIFFSNEKKSDREIWIAEEFLANFNIKFDKNEIRPESNDPPDILFRDARFEIKEIQDKGKKRHQEYKETLKKAKNARNISELFVHDTPQEISIQKIVDLIEEGLKKYIIDRSLSPTIDMLFYVNISSVWWFKNDSAYCFADKDVWERWRSVSMVENGKINFVFCANEDAPEFIRKNVGKFITKK